MGIVLIMSSCVEDEIVEAKFISMHQEGNVVVLKTEISSTEVILNTREAETCVEPDTIGREVSQVEDKSSYGKIRWIETGEIVQQIHNFKVVEKKCDVNIYLPVRRKSGIIDNVKTQFSFITEVPVLNDSCVSVSVDVDCDFVKFVQDPEYKEPYSTATYCFHLTVLQNDQEVERFSFERDFAWENTPITINPSVDDWEDSTENVNP